MNIYYPCKGLGKTNISNATKHVKESYDGVIKIPRIIGATIICEITLPGVSQYKVVEKRSIPAYSMNGGINRSSSKS